MSWIDISTPIRSDMVVWPGDTPVHVEQTMFLASGDPFNLTVLSMTAHTGTHVDAPRHFLADGVAIEQMPLDTLMGPAQVIDVDDPHAVRARHVPDDLEPGARILFRTRNSTEYLARPGFVEEFVYVSEEAALKLAAARVRMVGVDYLSVGGFQNDLRETHVALLGAGIYVVEGLVLTHIKPGRYELACLPLLIPGADGSPARALLRPLP
ncbi:cyclase family protein [uncultured Paludibaculum sp.]|uniref:cyclase family protein n=1 Tax=uncultured Paludibaculum sp. TaxID=1765020 RepID=UPI002AABC87A|nr:cyclase family protein [uncultured Paludibaculum sp.]